MGRARRSSSKSSGRRSSGIFSSSVERDNPRQLGLICGVGGVGDPVNSGSSPIIQANFLSPSWGSRKGFGIEGGSTDHASQGCGRGGTDIGMHPRLLLQNVSGSEEVRGVAADNRSQCFQQACRFSSLQDGDPTGNNCLRWGRDVGNFSRSEGCLFPYSNQEVGTEVPSLHLRRQGLPVPSHAFRSHHGSTGLHQAAAGRCEFPAFSKYRCSHLLRRFPHVAHGQGFVGAGYQYGPEALAESRFHSLQREVGGNPISGLCVSGLPFQYGVGHCSSTGRQVSEGSSLGSCVYEHVSGSGALVPQFSGVHQLPGRCGSFRTSAHQALANVSSRQLGPCFKGMGSNAPLNPIGEGLCFLVDSSGQCPPRGSSSQAESHHDPVHGCVHDGLGRIPGRTCPLRGVGRGTAFRAHQCAGDESSLAGSAISSGNAAVTSDMSGDGQLYSCRVSGEAGGHKVSRSVCSGYSGSSALSGDAIDYSRQASSGQSEHFSRYPLQTSTAGLDGVAVETLGVPGGLSGLGQTSYRSVCHSSEQSASNLCLAGPRSKGLGSRCPLSGLERDECLRISPVQSGGQGATEVSRATLFSASGSSLMAETALVSRAAISSGGSTPAVSSQSRPASATSVKNDAPSSSDPPPSRVEAITGGLAQAGFSEDVSQSIARSIRSSSSAIYQSRWRIFCDWCGERQIDPLKGSVQVIADFLLYLFRDRNLAPGTIAGYRSALASVLAFHGRPEVGTAPSLSAMIRGFGLDRPRVRQLAPQWNLAFVLDSLTKAPYEPMCNVSLKFLTLKTVFLIALASGRRRSEVHALSCLPSCLRWSRDFSAVSLVTDPAFLAKNQVPGFSPEPIRIPSLSSVVGSSGNDSLLCPCRALRFYLDKTRGWGGGRGSRFLGCFCPLNRVSRIVPHKLFPDGSVRLFVMLTRILMRGSVGIIRLGLMRFELWLHPGLSLMGHPFRISCLLPSGVVRLHLLTSI